MKSLKPKNSPQTLKTNSASNNTSKSIIEAPKQDKNTRISKKSQKKAKSAKPTNERPQNRPDGNAAKLKWDLDLVAMVNREKYRQLFAEHVEYGKRIQDLQQRKAATAKLLAGLRTLKIEG